MFGELKKVPLREMWPHESSDFTPWLAANIDELGLAIGMELELIEREASVGDFSLDLLAKDLGSTKTVIIENQLTQTDHDHLGKLLTYAAGFSASIVIWISEAIREEHRQALDWLNQRTDSDTLFFGVVVEVIKIDELKPAFNFKIAASPNEWQKSKSSRTPRASISTKGEKYRNYFQLLIDELREKHHFTGAKAGQPQNWYSFSSGISGITYGANFSQGGKARTEVYIDLGDQDKNKQVFDLLQQEATLIENDLGHNVDWERLNDKRASRLALYINGNIDDSDAELETVKN
ncbi:MAG: DUF4268 domain-containing protein [Candidatus Cloacimonadota bacterium]|nr:DUF4268 domain-containing protein [Candidatus Cloacimonadota bacterium]